MKKLLVFLLSASIIVPNNITVLAAQSKSSVTTRKTYVRGHWRTVRGHKFYVAPHFRTIPSARAKPIYHSRGSYQIRSYGSSGYYRSQPYRSSGYYRGNQYVENGYPSTKNMGSSYIYRTSGTYEFVPKFYTWKYLGSKYEEWSKPEKDKNNRSEKHNSPKKQDSKKSDKQSKPTLTGVVSEVIDGDTVKINGQVMRIWGIDAPELGQPFGPLSKTALESAVLNKEVKYTFIEKIYGRIPKIEMTAFVEDVKDEISIAELMAAYGYAYADPKTRSKSILFFEAFAQGKQLGIWQNGEDAHEPPWKYRQKLPLLKKPQKPEGKPIKIDN